MTDALKRIEEKHRAGEMEPWCEGCDGALEPCNVVKLARAFVEAVKIAKWACECHNTPQGPDPENCDACRLQVEAKRTLEEVAG